MLVQIKIFASGQLMLDSEVKPCLPAELSFEHAQLARVVMHEGRYHQVRRMFAACGDHVHALHRDAVGTLTLQGVPEGEFCSLDAAEVMRSAAGAVDLRCAPEAAPH